MNGIPSNFRVTRSSLSRVLLSLAVWGPGLLVMLADTDAGNIVAAAQGGAQWGYRLLPLLLLLIPLLYMVQELTVRLGIHTGRGHGELIREKFGAGWAWLSVVGLIAAVAGSMVAEFTGIAGVGEMYGLPRSLTLLIAAVMLLGVVATGSYRRMERAALIIGLFELAFFFVAWKAHPDLSVVARHAADQPFGNHDFRYLVAALIGAVFNPWMIFYQQSAVADKKLLPKHHRAARWDTAVGAILTQFLTASVLVATAATVGEKGGQIPLHTVGDISGTLTPYLGDQAGRLIFGMGVLGASMAAAIVSSLAMAWGIGEAAGHRRSLEHQPSQASWFFGIYALCVTGSAVLVWLAPSLIWLNVGSQVLNAFIFPLSVGFLIVLSTKALPEGQRLHGGYLWLLTAVSVVACAFGLFGGVSCLM